MKLTFSRMACVALVSVALTATACAQTQGSPYRQENAAQSRSRSATGNSLAGSYTCFPDCGATPIVLSANGNWSWGGYSRGTYTVSNGTVVFDGVGGPATWGPAIIGPDSLTFVDPRPPQKQVIYRRPSAIPPQLYGVYYGDSNATLELRPDGSWASTTPRGGGTYHVVGGKQVAFQGLEWGQADIGNGTLTFHPGGKLVGWNRIPVGTVWVFRKR